MCVWGGHQREGPTSDCPTLDQSFAPPVLPLPEEQGPQVSAIVEAGPSGKEFTDTFTFHLCSTLYPRTGTRTMALETCSTMALFSFFKELQLSPLPRQGN